MTITSMTGFGRAEGVAMDGALTWAWECRSVNGKGLDVRLRYPPGFDHVDQPARKAAAQQFSRGHVSLNLTVAFAGGKAAYAVNDALLDQLIGLVASRATGLPEGIAPARLDGLLTVKGVLEPADPAAAAGADRDARDEAIMAGLGQALLALAAARAEEGGRLHPILSEHMTEIDRLASEARALAAAQPDALRARLKAQVEELLQAASGLSEDRLVQEAALLAAKADVREELDRLDAHVAQARELLASGQAVGRRLEFLAQEFNREANTLCSKSQDKELTRIGLALKAVIDQFREQILNVE